jgi:hypothetical protein
MAIDSLPVRVQVPLTIKYTVYALLFCLAFTTPVTAGDILHERVDLESGHYQIALDVLLHAPATQVRTLLIDYPGLVRINPAIKQVLVLTSPDALHPRMRVLTRACFWYFCRTLTHVQEVREAPDGALIAEVLPRLSDFRYGTMIWRILPAEGNTRVEFRGDIVPAFWVPPVLGPLLIKRKLREEALETACAVEVLARAPR